MWLKIIFAFAFVLSCINPAAAAIVTFVVKGQVESIEYDAANGIITSGGNGPISTLFLESAPIGTAYTLTYSYDTEIAPYSSNPLVISYYLPLDATFTINNATFNILTPQMSMTSWSDGESYYLGGNFKTSPMRVNNLYPIDFQLGLYGSQADALYPPVPTSINLSDFPFKYSRVRFASINTGETGILFSVDSISSSISSVPETQIWALLLIGFGLVGICARRSRSHSRLEFELISS